MGSIPLFVAKNPVMLCLAIGMALLAQMAQLPLTRWAFRKSRDPRNPPDYVR